MNLHRPVVVGGVPLPGNLFFAPVAGYSDAAYRSLCVDQGADLCYTEMVSSEALVRNHPKTASLLERAENEVAYAIQLFGAKPAVLAAAAEKALAWKPLLIDLNCGCPVPKIVKSGAGSALIRKPELIGEIVRAMVAALAGTGVPVTVKIRSGWDEKSVNFLDAAAAAVQAGASAVTLHARTRAQGYSGRAAWEHIALLVRSVEVPVFGSGDVFAAQDARRMMESTGCAGVMIARGAIGHPFIFRDAAAALEGREPRQVTIIERAAAVRRHLELSARFLGERTACVEFRKHFCAYTKGTAGGAELRAEAVRASSVEAFLGLLDRWVASAAD